MKIDFAVISETGRRSNNEDFVKVIDYNNEGKWLGVVCDGMGGHAMGEVASETVCNTVCDYWGKHWDEDALIKARRACRAAAAKLNDQAFKCNHVQMGTTLVMASIEGNMITITHCGDSRCYLIRGNETVYQTKDHINESFGWEIISRCFFTYKPEAAVPEIAQFEVQPGDRILLCSDGLYKSMPPEILKARMMDDKSPEELLDVLAFLCEKNGDDNYSGILAIVKE